MGTLGSKLDALYKKIGDRGVLFALFIICAGLQIFFAAAATSPSIYPDEFKTVSLTAYFAGYDAYTLEGASTGSTGVGGWLTSLLYTPFYYFFKDPVVRYRGMLVANSIIISFIPLFVYRITGSLGIKKAWQKALTSICIILGVSAFAYSKFIWSETLCIFLPFLLLLLFTKATNMKNKASRLSVSFFSGIVCALAAVVDARLWGLITVYILTVIYIKYKLNVKSIMLIGFLPAFIIFTGLQLLIGERITLTVGSEVFTNHFLDNFNDFGNFIIKLFGELYYYTVSTWGLGVLGVCLCVSILLKKQKNLLTAFAFFALGFNIITIIISALYSGGVNSDRQDYYIFGRFIDGATPFMLVFVLVYVFMNSLDFRNVLYSVISTGGIFSLFFIFTAFELTSVQKISVQAIQGFSVIRFGTALDTPLTSDGLFFTVSATFCFAALLIVFVCCANKHRAHIISFCIAMVAVYTCVHSAMFYLPYETNRVEQENKEAYVISQFIYNSADAPPTYVLDINDVQLSPILQFLNRDTYIGAAESYSELPDDCFIIMKAMNTYDDMIVLGEAESLVFAAKGERAVAYAISQE